MKPDRLSSRLFWIVAALAMFPLGFLAFVATRGLFQATERMAKDSLQQLADQVSNRIDEMIFSQAQIVDGLAETISRPQLTQEMFRSLLDGYTLRFPELKRAGLVNLQGKLSISNDPSWNKPIESLLLSIKNTAIGQTVVSDFTWVNGFLPTLYLIHRLDPENSLLAEMNIAKLWQVIENIAIGKTGRTFVVDRTGQIIAHSSPEGKRYILEQTKSFFTESMPLNKEGISIAKYKNIFGVPVLGAIKSIRSLTWKVIIEQDRSEIYAASWSLSLLLGVLFCFLIALIAVVGNQTSRKVTRPLEDLVVATKKVAKGDFSVALPVHGRDERAQLTSAFNQMVQELVRLHSEITQRERMSVIGRIASELIHDLRHPIRNIENAAGLLHSRGNDSEVRQMFSRVTAREFQGLNRFLQQLEQLISDPALDFTKVDIGSEIHSLIETFQTFPEGSKIRWLFPNEDVPIVAYTDRFVLRRILQNVLRNAMEATPSHGTIRISAQQTSIVTIEIVDSGPGIPEDRLRTLFDALRTTKRRGLGLGLAISKKLIDQLGGEILAANNKEEGAIIKITLPSFPIGHAGTKDESMENTLLDHVTNTQTSIQMKV